MTQLPIDQHDYKYCICCVCRVVYDKETREIVDIPESEVASHGYCPVCYAIAMKELEEFKT